MEEGSIRSHCSLTYKLLRKLRSTSCNETCLLLYACTGQNNKCTVARFYYTLADIFSCCTTCSLVSIHVWSVFVRFCRFGLSKEKRKYSVLIFILVEVSSTRRKNMLVEIYAGYVLFDFIKNLDYTVERECAHSRSTV
jgi:hypothetical protein